MSDLDFDFGCEATEPSVEGRYTSETTGAVKPRARQPLRLDTRLAQSPQLHSMSMMPTPLISSIPDSLSVGESIAGRAGSHRVLSTSLVPDTISNIQSPSSPRLHQNLLPTITIAGKTEVATDHSSMAAKAALSRGDSLMVPKRAERSEAILSRSASVGGPQRQPSTILHREAKVPGFRRDNLPEEVYLAKDFTGAQSAWTRVKFVGKGSFSEVVLSRPAIEFVKAEYVEQVNELADRELSLLENEKEPRDENFVKNSGEKEQPSVLVAVKITALDNSQSHSHLEYFRRDLDIMSSIPHHPSVMRMIGSSLDQEHYQRAIFVLPFCPGGDLFDLVARHRSKLSSIVIRRLFADVCSAVVFLHEHNIVHRDIKLENVLLDINPFTLMAMDQPQYFNKPVAVLTDLGLARKIDPNDPHLTTRCGSDDYVPPELMLGQPYDGRETDSWALGVLLYSMLEGRLPFDAPPHAAPQEGGRARLRTAHRIARVDWNWYKHKDETNNDWLGGMDVVNMCLKRRANRRLAKETMKLPWVADARPKDIIDSHDTDHLWQLFIQ